MRKQVYFRFFLAENLKQGLNGPKIHFFKPMKYGETLNHRPSAREPGEAESQRKEKRKKGMRGIGGPLLTIGDLLSDVGEESGAAPDHHHHHDTSLPSPSSSSSSILNSIDAPQSLDLTKLFQENYEKLNEALAGSDHSWTALTLKLCTALETANKLVQSTDTNVRLLSEKVVELEKIVKRGDSAITAARAISISLNQKGGSSVGSQNKEQSRSHQEHMKS